MGHCGGSVWVSEAQWDSIGGSRVLCGGQWWSAWVHGSQWGSVGLRGVWGTVYINMFNDEINHVLSILNFLFSNNNNNKMQNILNKITLAS